MKPPIGVTAGTGSPRWNPDGDWWLSYAGAVAAAGGEPVYVDPRNPARLDSLKAVLLTGGRDVDVRLYPNPPDLHGEEPEAFMARHRMELEPLRDSAELSLTQAALERNLPVLGICRGCQVLNVALGGRLILDIPLETGTPVRHAGGPAPEWESAHHDVEILPGTMLAAILDPAVCTRVNSRHHQGVRPDGSLPSAVHVSAVSPADGLVEAIEVVGRSWAIGVQWHPERAADAEVHRLYQPLFRAFVRAAE